MEGMIQKSSSQADVAAAEAERDGYAKSIAEAFTGSVLGKQCAGVCECAGTCVCLGVGDFVSRTMPAAENSA